MTSPTALKPCPICTHPFDDHAMVPTREDATDGGVILCPVKDCQCFATWAAGDRTADDVYVPPPAVLSHMRASIQN